MKRILYLFVLMVLTASSGCRGSDMLFGLFGDHYTNGTTLEDKRTQYNSDIQKYEKPSY
jgi:hypothetical protein